MQNSKELQEEIRKPSAINTHFISALEIRLRYHFIPLEWQSIKRSDNIKSWWSNDNTYKLLVENNRMGKTRNLFKKIRDTKGTFHAKMGSIKDRNGMDLTEAEILRRGGKNTWKNCTKKIFTTRIITMV